MRFTTKLLSTALLTAAMAQPALAQQSYGSGASNPPAGAQMQQQRGQQMQISQQDIENYAEARMAVDEISNEWRGKVQDMSASEQEELNKTLMNAVQGSGLSVQEYNAISAALQQNEELQKRIIQAMQES